MLEVLVAFSILALSLGVLMQIFSQGTRNVAIGADYTKAVTIAESKLDAAGVVTPLDESSAGTELDGRYRWQLTSVPVDTDYAGPSSMLPYRLSVTVEWGAAEQPRSVSLETLKVARVQ